MSTAYRKISRVLDGLYSVSHLLACLSLASLAGLICVQVGARALDGVLGALGMEKTGFIIPSLAEIAGFLFVAGTFLALASTLRNGVHIRVTILLDHVPAAVTRALKFLAGLVGCALFAFAAYHAVLLVMDSIKFDEKSYGIIAIPLALPQGAMAAGLVIFAIAMLHEAVGALLMPADDETAPTPRSEPQAKRTDKPATGHGALEEDTHMNAKARSAPEPA